MCICMSPFTWFKLCVVSVDHTPLDCTNSLTGSLTLSMAYGLNIESESDEFYATSEEAMHAVDLALLPGSFLVDTFPLRECPSQCSCRNVFQYRPPPHTVKYVPAWFPGAGFKRFAMKAKKTFDKLADLPFQHVKESFQVGEPNSSCG